MATAASDWNADLLIFTEWWITFQLAMSRRLLTLLQIQLRKEKHHGRQEHDRQQETPQGEEDRAAETSQGSGY
jgi:hypothetical protein